MAEEFGFYEFGGDGGAVDFDERSLCAVAFGVDGTCDEVFSDARFARDEDASFGGRDDGDGVFNFEHGWGFAEDATEIRCGVGAFEALNFLCECTSFDGVSDAE